MKYIKLFEYFDVNKINSEEDLISKLKEYNIPYENWGSGEAKTVSNLLDELKNDECSIIDENGKLMRSIEFVGVRVFYTENGTKYYLKEDRQVFKDGRIRRRRIRSSIGEKMSFGEDPRIASLRGMKEELGVEIDDSQLIEQKDINYSNTSQSYPGIESKYIGHIFSCELRKDQYRPEGYVENQKDKSTYFVWEKVS